MTDNSFKFKVFGTTQNKFIDDNAFKYSLEQEKVNPKYLPIFEYFDKNNDKILDAQELANFKNALDNANNDDNPYGISRKEASSLLQNILGNDKKNVQELFGFLETIQSNYENQIETVSDGKIDLFGQGEEGDCWLLSGVNALSKTSWGEEAIKQSIQNNPQDRKYTINFKGVDFTCDISYDEVEQARKNPKRPGGDIDMLLLNIATEKYLKRELELNNIDDKENKLLNGGPLVGEFSMQYLLTGKTGNKFNFYPEKLTPDEIEGIKNLFKKYPDIVEGHNIDSDKTFDICDKNTAMKFLNTLADQSDNMLTCGFKKSKYWENKKEFRYSERRDDFSSQSEHVYTIEQILKDDNGNVTEIILCNPWLSDILIHKTPEEFLNQVSVIAVTNKNDNYECLTKMCEPYWANVINETP